MDLNGTSHPIAQARHWPLRAANAHRLVLLIEFLLTAALGCLLAWVAHPLASPAATNGLGDRYMSTSGAPDLQAQRAISLAASLPSLLPMLALSNWLAVRLGRSRLPRQSVAAGLLALWLLIWSFTFESGVNTRTLACLAALALAVIALALSLGKRSLARSVEGPVHALALPGWVLFTGLGLIWIVDFAARGYPKLRFLGLAHADALIFANAIMTICAALSKQLVAVFARACAAADRAVWQAPRNGLSRLAPLTLPLLFSLWCIGVALSFGNSRPAFTSELLRLPFFMMCAWNLHRWADLGHPRRAVTMGTLAVIAIVATLALTGDFGQVLLIAIGLATALGVGVTLLLGGRRLAAFAGVCATLVVIVGGLHLIHDYGYLVARHIGWRVEALDTPFGGRLEYLSELRWFAASTPLGGHGLTLVPWCGTVASLDLTAARCNGVPVQLASDYVFFGLAGVWGLWAAAGITLSLAFWLVSLVHIRIPTTAEDPDRLRSWLVACFVTVTLAQLLFTTLGGLGLVLLTGVTFPLMGFGSASLMVCAVFVGLALRR